MRSKLRVAIALVISAVGLFGIVISAVSILTVGNIPRAGMASLTKPFRINFKEAGISEQTLDTIIRGGTEATNAFHRLNAEQKTAIEDFQIVYASLQKTMTSVAEAVRTKSQVSLAISGFIFCAGGVLWVTRKGKSPVVAVQL
jgi:hypothetical protein